MQIIDKTQQLRNALNTEKKHGKTVALVPTMGNLHEGHLQLVRHAKKIADIAVVSIYVNPMQFGENEDLSSYPRTPTEDNAKLQAEQVDYLFTPNDQEVYPNGIKNHTRVNIEHLSNVLCGQSRTGHFDGVCTIVCKLLNLVQPTHAVFGQKDLQQLTIIKHMVSDLCMPINIVGVATNRESNGLAMSSRNGYLSNEQVTLAKNIYQTLTEAQTKIRDGNTNYTQICNHAKQQLKQLGFNTDYFEIRSLPSLALAKDGSEPDNFAIFAAAYLGNTRLIDNIILSDQ